MRKERFNQGQLIEYIDIDEITYEVTHWTPEGTTTRQATQDEIDYISGINQTRNRATIEEQAETALVRLKQIVDAASPTNAQVIAAVKDLARYQRKVIRLLLKKYDGTD